MARTPAAAPLDAASLDGAALGLVETFGLVAAIEAADAMLKAADVRLLRKQKTVPALITHAVVGETAAVRSAVDAGRAAAERVGRVVSVHVIPRPDASVWRLFGFPDAAAPLADAPASRSDDAPGGDYDARTVRELRALVRGRGGLGLEGRAVSRASKAELVAALRRA